MGDARAETLSTLKSRLTPNAGDKLEFPSRLSSTSLIIFCLLGVDHLDPRIQTDVLPGLLLFGPCLCLAAFSNDMSPALRFPEQAAFAHLQVPGSW